MSPDGLLAWLDALSGRAELTAVRYNVDPRFFALLYLGSIPPYLLSIAWLVKRMRQGANIFVPALSTIVFFALPAIYILVFGRNLPVWVPPAVIALLVAGGFSARREIRRRLGREGEESTRSTADLDIDEVERESELLSSASRPAGSNPGRVD